jgi:hypothetical protein
MRIATMPSTIHGGPITNERGKTKCSAAAASSASATGQRGSGERVVAGDGERGAADESRIALKLKLEAEPRLAGQR